jgi:MFS family permease
MEVKRGASIHIRRTSGAMGWAMVGGLLLALGAAVVGGRLGAHYGRRDDTKFREDEHVVVERTRLHPVG